MTPRRWTLATARAIFADVRDRTERAVMATDALLEQRDSLSPGSVERLEVEGRIEAEVSQWAREMEALGLEARGIWLIDFDTGSGYLCWKWPEERLDHFHTYEDGFDGRSPIQ